MKNFEKYTLRLAVYRGGGIEISLDHLGFEGEYMTAYQNYLGGGILGAIQNDCTIPNWQSVPKIQNEAQELAKYFHSLTCHADEYESCSFKDNQKRPTNSYE